MPSVLDMLDAAIPDEKPTKKESTTYNDYNAELVLGQVISDDSNRPNARTHNKSSGDIDPELEDMQREVNLLSLIQQDTGESGSGSGDIIYFKKCPICGHNDCFRFYPSTNTWACFGGSNDNANVEGRDGGAYIKYVIRTGKATDSTEAVRMLRNATGHQYESGAKKAHDLPKERGDEQKLFPGLDARLLHTDQLTGENRRSKPGYIIDGLVSEQSINMIAAPSKQCKSWLAQSMCWAASGGKPWMGQFECRRQRVLYVDIELGEDWLSQRLDATKAKEGYDSGFNVISLKGDIQTNLTTLRSWLTSDHPRDFDLVVIDPLYLFEEGEENAAETWIPIMRELGALQKGCNCAVVYVHHFSKAWYNQPPENRPAGSGVIGRFYEQAIILSPRQLDAAGESALSEKYGDKARVYEFFTASRNYEEADIKTVVWCWPSFYADTAHEYDHFPVTGSKEGNRILGTAQSEERCQRIRSAKDEAVGMAVKQCRDAEEPATRPNVYKRLRESCDAMHIDYPTESTFKGWTRRGGCTHWRCDPKRGYELHAIDVDMVDEDGNAPFLPMPD